MECTSEGIPEERLNVIVNTQRPACVGSIVTQLTFMLRMLAPLVHVVLGVADLVQSV